MQYQWLNQKNNKKLILFFNGWGMNLTPIQHLKYDDFDILTISDYRDFNFNINQFDFSKYDEKYLICWSMGVYVCNLFYDILKDFNKKIAIAGTLKIIDNQFGIPEKIYNITIKFFSAESVAKFIKNMFDNLTVPEITITKSTDELKEELIAIKNLKIEKELNFNKAIIPINDVIIPSKNQLNYWLNKTEIVKVNTPHYPFHIYKTWQEIIC